MDIIYECAFKFLKLLSVKYHFVVVHNRKAIDIVIDFMPEDFKHAIGLQYIDDIAIERKPIRIIDAILDKKITDTVLLKH